MHSWRLIGDILVEDFDLAREQVDAALAEQQQTPKRLGELLQARQAIIMHEIFSPPKAMRHQPEAWEM